MATLGEVAVVLKRLADAYGQTISHDQAKAYYMSVGRYPRMEIACAANDLIDAGSWFPKPADINKKIRERWGKGIRFTARTKEDEQCHWRMFQQAIISPDDLSADEVKAIYGPGTVIPDGEYMNRDFYYNGARK